MKRILLSILVCLSLVSPVVVAGGTAGAVDIFQNACSGNGATTTACKSVSDQGQNGPNPIIKIIGAAIQVLSFIIGVAAIISLVVGGIRLMTAGGDSNSIASARSTIVTALIGVAVAALAQVIVLFVIRQ